MARHYYLGGNTPLGFFSYYDYLIEQEKAKKIYVIKGGPGTGKSTLMKHIGLWAEENGYDVDYLHCSSDPDSMDGLIIDNLKIALVDGTAPHIVDPKNPGAVDCIINLGDFWNEISMKSCKNNIINLNKTIKNNFERAYRYLAAAKAFYDDIKDIYKSAIDEISIIESAQAIINKEIHSKAGFAKKGFNRKLFVTAVTPKGVKSYLETLPKNMKTYVIKSEWGTGGNILLSKVAEVAILSGLNIESFYNPMEPKEYIEHLIIKDLNLALITENKYNSYSGKPYETINLNRFINENELKDYSSELKFALDNMHSLIDEATKVIFKSKTIHDQLEQFYVPNMDFHKINKKEKEVLEDIKKQIKEK